MWATMLLFQRAPHVWHDNAPSGALERNKLILGSSVTCLKLKAQRKVNLRLLHFVAKMLKFGPRVISCCDVEKSMIFERSRLPGCDIIGRALSVAHRARPGRPHTHHHAASYSQSLPIIEREITCPMHECPLPKKTRGAFFRGPHRPVKKTRSLSASQKISGRWVIFYRSLRNLLRSSFFAEALRISPSEPLSQ